ALLMGTDVEVRSSGTTGAEFVIDFPESVSGVAEEILLERSEETSGENAQEESPATRERLLIVDDNEEMLSFLRELLAPSYDVECACDAEKGMEILSSWIPDLIITDVMMPGIDGMEFCRRLKQDIATSHIPVVLLTAKVEDEDFVTGFDSGADMYVTKPFSTDVVKARIRGLLANRARLRERFVADPAVIEEIAPN
ncbi:MAG: response regulator, partial [Muribaculaceae bacterium]|nr:response regulator [Muribaculaceae bacterium]